jgi:hypothetical protein
MVSRGFDNDSRNAELDWMERRMYMVEEAENTLQGIRYSKASIFDGYVLFSIRVPFIFLRPK